MAVHWPLGGIRTHLLYNYPYIIRAGFQLTFVAPASKEFNEFQEEVAHWKGVEFFGVPAQGPKCRLHRTLRHLLRQRRFSLIHSHGWAAAVDAVRANHRLLVPHVFTAHAVIRPSVDFPGVLGKIKMAIMGRLLSRIDTVIMVSQDALDNHCLCLPSLRKGPCRIVKITHGIDLTRFSDDQCRPAFDLRRRLGLDESTFLMGFLGRFEQEKGFQYLLEALDRVLAKAGPNSFHLVAVGRERCPGRFESELARRPQVAHHLTFLEHVPNIAPILKELDLVVMPSVSEACGLVAIEAMCVGTPVLGTDCAGLREVLNDTPSIVVPAASSSALADGILLAASNPSLQETSRSYRPIAWSRFDVENSAKELLRVFESHVSQIGCQRTGLT